jgi:hypothetical protein
MTRPGNMRILTVCTLLVMAGLVRAAVGDPQLATDHPWYPGELACSTFERLAKTQAELYERVVGVRPTSDEQRALAAWLWRNTHYFHAEDGAEDLWGLGFTQGGDLRTREYWTGLFAHGFGLCGTTHAQWTAEMEALLGHNCGRTAGVDGHNSFEVFLSGGPYGNGKWVLLDHDVSTVVFNRQGTALLSIPEVRANWKRLTNRSFAPEKQHGWLVCGLHPDDGGVYRRYEAAEYLAGYAGPPPMVHLRRGETLRRYLQPGLADGKTFVFWGNNAHSGAIPGPEQSHTWVNQPDRMHGSRTGAGSNPGQARYANAVYTYRPDFTASDYRESVIEEDGDHLVLAFYTPYIIGATPATDKPWGIYDPGCRNGLVLHGRAKCAVAVSTDQGRTWQECGPFTDGMDLTDRVKGRRQYWLRFRSGAPELRDSSLTMTTVCQANGATMPRLKQGGSTVRLEASGRAVVSAGPNLEQARSHLVAGQFGTAEITLEIATPHHEPVLTVDAAAHVLSGSPPKSDVKYQIEVSTDAGRTWQPLVKDWTISRRGHEPRDFWSQSFCWGTRQLLDSKADKVRVRFSNSGRRPYNRAEAHLVYRTATQDKTQATFAWTDDSGPHQARHQFEATPNKQEVWTIPTGRNVETHWVDLEPVH